MKTEFEISDVVVVNVDPLPWTSPKRRRDDLIAGVHTIDELGASFNLSAFPLPMRIGLRDAGTGFCWDCMAGPEGALHVTMKILPRSAHELSTLKRDAQGMLELSTCTTVTQRKLDEIGPEAAVERIRGKIKDMVLHEVYEALLFKGERIMDPHNETLRPVDQPF